MTESNKLTVTYNTPKKTWAVIELNETENKLICIYESYDEAVKKCHTLNEIYKKSYIYTVYESVYYTGSIRAKYYGMEFKSNLDNGDMEWLK